MHYSKMCYNVSNGGALVYQRMVQSLEQYVAQATQAYQPAQTAVQNQINALSGQLETANEAINKNYAQQQAGLNRQRNMAAETASMQAAGSGGSFGGAANLANRKYYDQTFVPAVTQLRTGQANELAQARQANENQRTALNSQLSQLQAQANREALQQYWNAQEAEEQRKAQIAAARASNPIRYIDDGYGNGVANKNNVSFTDWITGYSGWDDNTKNYWVNNINNIQNRGGATANIIKSALSKSLQNTPQYREYLNWRNS